jgi:hypothetical protein
MKMMAEAEMVVAEKAEMMAEIKEGQKSLF